MDLPITTKTTNYTITDSDYTVICDATAGNIVITIPNSIIGNGRILEFKLVSAVNKVTLTPEATGTIDGAVNYELTVQYDAVQIQAAGYKKWVIL